MKDLHNFKTIEIKLPKHLVEWLEEFSKEIAMEPSQLMANILTYYYEAYKRGFEKGRETSSLGVAISGEPTGVVEIGNVEELVRKYINEEKVKKGTFIIRRFASWIKDKHINPLELKDETIKEFLEDYLKEHSISESTYHKYRRALERFIEFLSKSLK
ncbi:MAG: hypothetical protein B7O98_09015 [Zestosphaera tikiterensis]|uniref:Core-binding (CB) domain-containing protein n=1 Tax=Zestosphaera tikiterensis TaxID=1973259 RepID=A0A2R7Y2G9_9CREN|nr:MAG: hypothetical protein B7O98_09015 [Zestosphaera tikiterensis]